MSKIGKKPIIISEGVTVTKSDNNILIKSSRGELLQEIPRGIDVDIKDQQIIVSVPKPNRQTKALHGLTRSLLANMMIGVIQGFEKVLELQGTGYRVNPKDKGIELSLGYSHPIFFEPPPGITLTVESNKIIKITGCDKQLVGQVAAKIRNFRKPDVYKGKGIRYQGEIIKLKPGKAAKAMGAEA